MKDKVYVVYCPTCNDVYSVEGSEGDARRMAWKHYWKSKGHIREKGDIANVFLISSAANVSVIDMGSRQWLDS